MQSQGPCSGRLCVAAQPLPASLEMQLLAMFAVTLMVFHVSEYVLAAVIMPTPLSRHCGYADD